MLWSHGSERAGKQKISIAFGIRAIGRNNGFLPIAFIGQKSCVYVCIGKCTLMYERWDFKRIHWTHSTSVRHPDRTCQINLQICVAINCPSFLFVICVFNCDKIIPLWIGIDGPLVVIIICVCLLASSSSSILFIYTQRQITNKFVLWITESDWQTNWFD